MRFLRGLSLIGMTLLVACATEATQEEDDNPESQEGAWDAQSVNREGDSTHLWIVNRGVDILAKHAAADANAKRVAAIMNDPTCRSRWQQGLYDADFKAEYNDGNSDLQEHPSDIAVARSGATWASHFYDPDTGKNYKGTDKTAFTESKGHLERALGSQLESKAPGACYELGVALHYYTDLTQPMHATNFTALDRPAKLHSNIEGYAMEIQDRFVLRDWSGPPAAHQTPSDFIIKTAKDSKPLFMEGVGAIVNAYKTYTGWHILTCRNIDAAAWRFIERQHLDYRHCWEGNAGVDAAIGKTLTSAEEHTAQFLYIIGQQLPEASQP